MKVLFGTFGVRGIVNENMTCELAMGLGKAFATHLGRGTVVLGTDVRLSRMMLKCAFGAGVMSCGVNVIDVDLAPTPAIQFATKLFGAQGGCIITASHNPPEYNGIKLLEGSGCGLSRNKEEKVADIFSRKAFSGSSWKNVGALERRVVLPSYMEKVKSLIDSDAIKRRKPMIVVDCGNGAGGLVTPHLLSDLGCHVISLNAEPDGRFPSRRPEPSEDNLALLKKLVPALGADFGCAHDGDGDRTIFIDECGSFIFGDKSFAIITRDMLGAGKVVTTVATSHIIDAVAKQTGGSVIKTVVGDLIVSSTVEREKAVLGGEENGGVIFPKLVLGRDGAMVACKMAEIFSKYDGTFSQLVGSLPRFYQRKGKIPCPEEKKAWILKRIEENFSGHSIDRTDGLKVFFGEDWFILRVSGTEPIIRCFSEAKDEKKAEELLRLGLETVEKVL